MSGWHFRHYSSLHLVVGSCPPPETFLVVCLGPGIGLVVAVFGYLLDLKEISCLEFFAKKSGKGRLTRPLF